MRAFTPKDTPEDQDHDSEPHRTVVLKSGQTPAQSVKGKKLESGHTTFVDGNGNKILSVYLPSKRLSFIDSSDATWMKLDEVMEDVAKAYSGKVSVTQFVQAALTAAKFLK